MAVTVGDIKAIIDEAGVLADLDDIQTDLPLRQQNIDSLDMANILLLIEEKYELDVPDKDLDRLQSIDGIIKYLDEMIG